MIEELLADAKLMLGKTLEERLAKSRAMTVELNKKLAAQYKRTEPTEEILNKVCDL